MSRLDITLPDGPEPLAQSRETEVGWLRQAAVRGLSIVAAHAPLVAGLYAWGVTVLPVAMHSEGAVPAWLAAAALLVHFATTIRSQVSFRVWVVGTYGFLGLSTAVWLLARQEVVAADMTTVRGVLGMLGWSLFALSSLGAPPVAIPRRPSGAKGGLRARFNSPGARGQGALLLVVIAAIGVQLLGWGGRLTELSSLYRLLLLVASLSLLSLAGPLALKFTSRKGGRRRGKEKPRPFDGGPLRPDAKIGKRRLRP